MSFDTIFFFYEHEFSGTKSERTGCGKKLCAILSTRIHTPEFTKN